LAGIQHFHVLSSKEITDFWPKELQIVPADDLFEWFTNK